MQLAREPNKNVEEENEEIKKGRREKIRYREVGNRLLFCRPYSFNIQEAISP